MSAKHTPEPWKTRKGNTRRHGVTPMTADPCPWCGDEAVMEPEALFPDVDRHEEPFAATHCESCGAAVFVEPVVIMRYLVKRYSEGE